MDKAEARKIALSKIEDKMWFNLCTEYDNAFVFSKYDDISIGGTPGPCVVMKGSGEALNFVAALSGIGEEKARWLMSADGEFSEVSEEQLEALQD